MVISLSKVTKQLAAKKIVYTSGDPAGIGLDIILQAAQQFSFDELVVLANPVLIEHRTQQLGLSIDFMNEDDAGVAGVGCLRLRPINLDQVLENSFDNLSSADTANYVLAMLDIAIEGCLTGQYVAMVTGPLNKALINDAGINFSGHTEYLAEKTQANLPVMMLATEGLRVALMTTHLPLKDVSEAIDQDLVKTVCRIVWNDLRDKFQIQQPKVLICGLNPHAGENGYLGREEIDTIQPALAQLKQEGIEIDGPYPADTLFQPRYLDGADVVISMFHDQGLPVLKFKGFGKAANITLGLPIVRTSVDHGTAYDLAGSGKADIGSLLTAIATAKEMVV